MIKITILCFVMIFTQCLTLASPQDAGQDAAALKVKKLARKLEKTVRARKERWVPEKRQLAGTYIYIRWTSGKKALAVTTNYQPSAEEASRVMHISATTISASLTATKITGFGDEAYRVRLGEEKCTIIFRKNNIIVYVEAPNEADADTFAKVAADSLAQP